MVLKTRTSSTSRAEQRALRTLSPFELKDRLIALAADSERASHAQMLNAGRGNPNWVCATPREAFATLLRFGIEESRRGISVPDFGRIPQKHGIAERFAGFLATESKAPGARLLRASLDYGTHALQFDPDEFVHELAEGVIGCQYPDPGRMLRFAERIVHEYLARELCAGKPPASGICSRSRAAPRESATSSIP